MVGRGGWWWWVRSSGPSEVVMAHCGDGGGVYSGGGGAHGRSRRSGRRGCPRIVALYTCNTMVGMPELLDAVCRHARPHLELRSLWIPPHVRVRRRGPEAHPLRPRRTRAARGHGRRGRRRCQSARPRGLPRRGRRCRQRRHGRRVRIGQRRRVRSSRRRCAARRHSRRRTEQRRRLARRGRRRSPGGQRTRRRRPAGRATGASASAPAACGDGDLATARPRHRGRARAWPSGAHPHLRRARLYAVAQVPLRRSGLKRPSERFFDLEVGGFFWWSEPTRAAAPRRPTCPCRKSSGLCYWSMPARRGGQEGAEEYDDGLRMDFSTFYGEF